MLRFLGNSLCLGLLLPLMVILCSASSEKVVIVFDRQAIVQKFVFSDEEISVNKHQPESILVKLYLLNSLQSVLKPLGVEKPSGAFLGVQQSRRARLNDPVAMAREGTLSSTSLLYQKVGDNISIDGGWKKDVFHPKNTIDHIIEHYRDSSNNQFLVTSYASLKQQKSFEWDFSYKGIRMTCFLNVGEDKVNHLDVIRIYQALIDFLSQRQQEVEVYE